MCKDLHDSTTLTIPEKHAEAFLSITALGFKGEKVGSLYYFDRPGM